MSPMSSNQADVTGNADPISHLENISCALLDVSEALHDYASRIVENTQQAKSILDAAQG